MFSYGITVGIPNEARTDHNPSNLSQPDLNLTFIDDETNDTKKQLKFMTLKLNLTENNCETDQY